METPGPVPAIWTPAGSWATIVPKPAACDRVYVPGGTLIETVPAKALASSTAARREHWFDASAQTGFGPGDASWVSLAVFTVNVTCGGGKVRGDWVSIGLFACAALDAAAGVVSSTTASGPMTSARLRTPPNSCANVNGRSRHCGAPSPL